MSLVTRLTNLFRKDTAQMDSPSLENRIAELETKLAEAQRRIPAAKVVMSAEELEAKNVEELQDVFAKHSTPIHRDMNPYIDLKNRHIIGESVPTYVSADGSIVPEPSPYITRSGK